MAASPKGDAVRRLGFIADRRIAGSLGGVVLRRRLEAMGVAARRAKGGEQLPLVAASSAAARVVGLSTDVVEEADDAGGAAEANRSPRIALFTGPCVGYPYYAYYSHALLSLGLTYFPVDAAAIAKGALESADVLVIPGGFAIWGLDKAEAAPGADRAAQRFLDAGGGYIGSCGGAYYASSGRIGWTGMADVKPKYTSEYLQTGAGVVNVTLNLDDFADGVGREIEIPYYHGPSWPSAGTNAHVIATFESLALPSRLFIDNPLDRTKFEADLAGRPAALLTGAEAGRGRGVLFSMHPEMGEMVRRHIALDGYVRKFLPIRGEKVLDDTLRHYAPEDAQAFRLIDRALDVVAPKERGALRRPADSAEAERISEALTTTAEALRGATNQLAARLEAAPSDAKDWSKLVDRDLARVAATGQTAIDQLAAAARTLNGFPDASLATLLPTALADARPVLAALEARTPIEALAMIELPARIAIAAARIVACDRALDAALARA